MRVRRKNKSERCNGTGHTRGRLHTKGTRNKTGPLMLRTRKIKACKLHKTLPYKHLNVLTRNQSLRVVFYFFVSVASTIVVFLLFLFNRVEVID